MQKRRVGAQEENRKRERGEDMREETKRGKVEQRERKGGRL